MNICVHAALPAGQNAASVRWLGSVQIFLERISRADAASEWLTLHRLFFFSLCGASAEARYRCGGGLEEQRHYV